MSLDRPVLDPARFAAVRSILAALADSARSPVWLVGGAVRDALLDRDVRDLDLALPGGSVAAARRLADRLGAAFVPLGEPHGVGRVVVPATGARGPVTVDLADFRGPSLEEDLAGRDLTVNALAVRLADLLAGAAAVADPTGGLGDLGARRLRAPRPAAFRDDPARVLRLLRLRHDLGFTVDPDTAHLARAAVPALPSVAAERLRDEVTGLLRLSDTAAALREADDWSALGTLLPESAAMRATTQSTPHRFTVWEHSLRAVEAADRLLLGLQLLAPHTVRVAAHLSEAVGSGLARREVLKLGALLHDVAKPETRSEDAGGRVRFIGHDRLGAARTRAIAARLRWPGRATEILTRLVRHHLRPMHLGLLPAVSRRARYRFFRDVGEDVPSLVCLTIADAAATDGRPPAQVYQGVAGALLSSLLAGEVEAAREAAAPPLLRGDDVMRAFGLPPGPEVGRLLARAREAQAIGLARTPEEALRYLSAPPPDVEEPPPDQPASPRG